MFEIIISNPNDIDILLAHLIVDNIDNTVTSINKVLIDNKIYPEHSPGLFTIKKLTQQLDINYSSSETVKQRKKWIKIEKIKYFNVPKKEAYLCNDTECPYSPHN
jgi:hypothetical protein